MKHRERLFKISHFAKNVPPLYRDACTSKLKWEDNQNPTILKWKKCPKHFLMLMGIPGCGKTYTTYAVIFDYLETRYQKEFKEDDAFYYENIFFYKCHKLFDKIKFLMGNNYESDKFKNLLVTCDLLILDDLGASYNTKFEVTTLLEILDERASHYRPTIITTNFNFKEIEEEIDERIASRLQSKHNVIIQDWMNDYRIPYTSE